MAGEGNMEDTPAKESLQLEKRVGRFSISAEFVRTEPEALLDLLGLLRVVVVRCEHVYHCREFQYIGLSPHFDIIDRGAQPPFYSFTFRKEEGVTHLDKVERCDDRFRAACEDGTW